MKKCVLWLALLAMILSLAACADKKDKDRSDRSEKKNEPTEETVAQVDFETQLRLDAFPQDDELMKLVGDAVVFRDIDDLGDRISFTVRAPAFSQELIDWYNSQEAPSQEDLTEKIRQLLQQEKQDTPITLEYTVGDDGTVHFRYTEEYLNAAGCGLRQFYAYYYEAVMGQMGGNADE